MILYDFIVRKSKGFFLFVGFVMMFILMFRNYGIYVSKEIEKDFFNIFICESYVTLDFMYMNILY